MLQMNYEIIMKLLITHYEMTLVKIIKINRSVYMYNISIEYWSKRKKTLLHYFDIKTKQIYMKKIYISSTVENGKYINYQYNSEQMFTIFSNRIKIKYN